METIRLEVRDAVCWVTFDRPENANSMNEDFFREIRQVSLRCASDASIRAVVLTGTGRFFSAGGDAKAFAALGEELPRFVLDMTGHFHSAIARFAQLDAPIIAAVNGVAAGGALCLVGMADLAIAARSAKFALAFPGIGFSIDSGGTFFLPKILGTRRVLELALTGRTLSAEEALGWGLVNSVVDDDDLVAEVDALARRLAAGPTAAYGAIKRLVHAGWSATMETQMERESQVLSRLTAGPDAQEGLRAFVAKCPPKFQGG